MQEAQKVAEEIHRAVGELPVTGEEVMPSGRLTISLGLASLDAADSGYEALLNRRTPPCTAPSICGGTPLRFIPLPSTNTITRTAAARAARSLSTL